jgi:transcriptional regulator with XRE-family HTH domain
MDKAGIGADIRLLRMRRGWTQGRLAAEAGISISTLSLMECGHADRLTLKTTERVIEALEARLSVRVYWRGEGLDRLRDHRHAAIVEQTIRYLEQVGWSVKTEVSFNEFGERGSIDILAWHRATSALLVIEVKSVVPDLQAMLSTLDRKARLAPGIARSLGWPSGDTSRLLVLPDDRTARRRIHDHHATFITALPTRTAAVKRWLRAQGAAAEPMAGILFLSDSNHGGNRQRRRVSCG